MKTNANSLEQQIISTLDLAVNYLHEHKIYSDKNWTSYFKETLAELGKTHENEICTSGFTDIYNSEWLYDMVWYKNEKGYLSEVSLVVESEWGSHINQIKFDFEKLLSSNSIHRLMICQSHSSNLEKLINCFDEAINHYKQNKPGDRYLVAILDKTDEEFCYEVFQK